MIMSDFNLNQGFGEETNEPKIFRGEITGRENQEQTVYPVSNPVPPSAYDARQTFRTPEPPKPKKKKKFLGVIALACVFGLVAGIVFQGVNLAGNLLFGGKQQKATTLSPAVIQTATGGESGSVTDVSAVTEAVMPAMVSINVVATKTMQNNSFGGFFGGFGNNYEYETQGSGSGIVISDTETELLIVTNNHVVEDATAISVTFIDGNSYDATIKGTDSDFDLAVISIQKSLISEETMQAIKVAVLGDSTTLKLGEPAVAIGNALGFGQAVTVGYISVVSREVQLTDNTMTLIQTDAAINPGNSGGALVNMRGEVVGINSSKYSSTDVEGIGFAIPISDAIPVINDLMNETNLPEEQQGYLGIRGADVTSSYQKTFGWPKGIFVSSVTAGSPAALAGMRAQDIIVSFDGRETLSMDALQARLKRKTSGDQVEVIVQRQNADGSFAEVSMTVTLISRSQAE